MSNRAWMPLHIEAYLSDTDHLSATEHGAYMLLIMKYWRDGGLPADEGMIRRYAKLTPEQWADSRDILAAFFEDGWRHKRIDAELSKADEIIEKRRAAAEAKHAKSKRPAHAEHMQSKCSDTRVPPSTDNHSSEAKASSSPEPAKAAPAVIELPCVSGEPYPVSEDDVAEWRAAFPAVDIRQQLAAMRSWLIANDKRRKTRRGMRRFIVSWLDRAQNSAHAPPPRQATSPPPKQTVGQQARDELRRMGMMPDVANDQTRYRDESDGSADFAGAGIAGRIAFEASGRGRH